MSTFSNEPLFDLVSDSRDIVVDFLVVVVVEVVVPTVVNFVDNEVSISFNCLSGVIFHTSNSSPSFKQA